MSKGASSDRPNEVVVLDDEIRWLQFFTRLNEKNGSRFQFKTFTSHGEALEYARESKSKGNLFAAIVDIELRSETNGLDFIQLAQEAGVTVPFIVSTQYSTEDLVAQGVGINAILGNTVSYFVEKETLRFDDEQNVDRITEEANSVYQDSLRRILKDYATKNINLLGHWREAISDIAAEVDQIVIYSGPVEEAESTTAGSLLATPRSSMLALRGKLIGLMGRMQFDHLQAAAASFRRPVHDRESTSEDRDTGPEFAQLAALAARVFKVAEARGGETDLSPTAERESRLQFAGDIESAVGSVKNIEGAIALSIAIEQLYRAKRKGESLLLALGAADYFAMKHDPDHEVAFSTIAARVSAKLGRHGQRDLCLRRAERVAIRTGRASLKLELHALDGR